MSAVKTASVDERKAVQIAVVLGGEKDCMRQMSLNRLGSTRLASRGRVPSSRPRQHAGETTRRVDTMALPLPPGLTPPEVAFLCEMELVTIIPRQRLEGLQLLGVGLPRHTPPCMARRPLWEA